MKLSVSYQTGGLGSLIKAPSVTLTIPNTLVDIVQSLLKVPVSFITDTLKIKLKDFNPNSNSLVKDYVKSLILKEKYTIKTDLEKSQVLYLIQGKVHLIFFH